MIYLVGLIVGVAFYLICFIATNDWIISLLPSLTALVYFTFFATPQITKYTTKMKYFRLTNQFVNNFVVSLSIQPVLEVAFNNSLASLNYDFKNKLKGIEQLNPTEKVRYLANYFSFNHYQVFIQIVDLWQEQGGNILQMSSFLISQFRETNDYLLSCQRLGEKKTVEFVILWLFSLAIIVVLRFALTQFYTFISNNAIYKFGVAALLLFALFSTQVLISKVTSIDLKGWSKNDK